MYRSPLAGAVSRRVSTSSNSSDGISEKINIEIVRRKFHLIATCFLNYVCQLAINFVRNIRQRMSVAFHFSSQRPLARWLEKAYEKKKKNTC